MWRKGIVTKAKVIKEIIKDPTLSQRDIAKKTWIPKSTVAFHSKDIGQNGAESKIIDTIIANDMDIVTLWQSLLVKRMQKTPEKLSTKDIISATDTWARRITIFKWDVTKDDWWLKDWVTIVRWQ